MTPARSRAPLTSRRSVAGALARFWKRSYAADYLSLLLVVGLLVLINAFATPFHQLFSLDDPHIQFPFAMHERVSLMWTILLAAALPLTIIITWSLLVPTPKSRSPSPSRPPSLVASSVTFHSPRSPPTPRPSSPASPSGRGGHTARVAVLGLLVSLALTACLTDAIKNAAGRPRPDFLARCAPRRGTPAHGLVGAEVCTTGGAALIGDDGVSAAAADHLLQEGWRSFPSGHSSFAFAGLGYLSFFLSGQLHIFSPVNRHGVDDSPAGLAHSLLAFLLPLSGAVAIALSRLADYRHDVLDVTAGAALGLAVAYPTYRRYFPSLRTRHSEWPYVRFPTSFSDVWDARGVDRDVLDRMERGDQFVEAMPLRAR